MFEEYGAGLGGGVGLLPIELLLDICRLGLTGGVGRLHVWIGTKRCGGRGDYTYHPLQGSPQPEIKA